MKFETLHVIVVLSVNTGVNKVLSKKKAAAAVRKSSWDISIQAQNLHKKKQHILR